MCAFRIQWPTNVSPSQGSRCDPQTGAPAPLRLEPPGGGGAGSEVPGFERVAAAGGAALTFDDGPDPVFTPPLLDALDAARARRATFFVVGERIPGTRGAPGRDRAPRPRGRPARDDPPPPRRARRRARRGPSSTEGLAAIAAAARHPPALVPPALRRLLPALARFCGELGLGLAYWSTWGQDWEPISAAEDRRPRPARLRRRLRGPPPRLPPLRRARRRPADDRGAHADRRRRPRAKPATANPQRRRRCRTQLTRRQAGALLVCSPGGHLLQMLRLEPAWRQMRPHLDDARGRRLQPPLARGASRLRQAPDQPQPRALLANLRSPGACAPRAARRDPLHRRRPRRPLLPRRQAARLPAGLRREPHPDRGALARRPLVYPLADAFFVQWPAAAKRKRARYVGGLL